MSKQPTSRRVSDAFTPEVVTQLIQSADKWGKDYAKAPDGVFGSVATVRTGSVTLQSDEIDLEFSIPFDDDLNPNEGEVVAYNLTDSTINQIKYHAPITVEAGYKGDTDVVFSGYVSKVSTSYSGADKATTIKMLDDIATHTVESLSFAAGSKASYILRQLLSKTGLPIAVFKVQEDYTYKDAQTVDGDLMQAIKTQADACNISVYVCKGKIYARNLKDGDDLHFLATADTGLINSPEPFEEEQTVNNTTRTVNGYRLTMLLQHRLYTGGIVQVQAQGVNGSYRVRSGTHTFNSTDCTTEVEVVA